MIQVYTCRMRCEPLHTWLEELVDGPLSLAISSPMYYTRGYAFKIFREGHSRTTINSEISVQASALTYYGVLKEILEIEYPGVIHLKCIVFCVIGMIQSLVEVYFKANLVGKVFFFGDKIVRTHTAISLRGFL